MPAPFLNIQFPPRVALGATGGPGFSTQVVALASGAENRNANWAKARGNWDISTGIRTREQMAEVIAHFYVVGGKARSFRFKDWADYEAVDVVMIPVTTTVFQLVKRYARGGSEYVRTITKPVTGTVAVKVSGSPVTPSAVDHLTGRVTFASAPAATPTATYQFDVPVRFDTDQLPVQALTPDLMVVPQIDLIEVRE